ncbi:hypothetical protein SAMN05216295_113112 [Pseudomonas luteola]|nr:hypothetical protein SAMN05216295_113112 [Pseudomonas zeshuii]
MIKVIPSLTLSLRLPRGEQGILNHMKVLKMNAVKSFFIASALMLSSLAMAESGGDHVFDRMAQAREASVAAMQTQESKAATIVAEDKETRKHSHC